MRWRFRVDPYRVQIQYNFICYFQAYRIDNMFVGTNNSKINSKLHYLFLPIYLFMSNYLFLCQHVPINDSEKKNYPCSFQNISINYSWMLKYANKLKLFLSLLLISMLVCALWLHNHRHAGVKKSISLICFHFFFMYFQCWTLILHRVDLKGGYMN